MWIGEASGGGFSSFAFAPDGTIYTGDDFGSVLAWDRQTHESQELFQLGEIHGHGQAAWQLVLNPEATRLFIPALDRINVLDLPEGTSKQHIRNTPRLAQRISLSPDGNRLVAVSSDNHAVVWDASTLQKQKLPGPLGQSRNVAFAAFVENGTRLLVMGWKDEEMSLWDVKTGERVRVTSTKEVWCRICDLSANGSCFAARSTDEFEVGVYRQPDWTRCATIRHAGKIESLALNPTGDLLAATDGTKSVTLFDTRTSAKVGTWNWRIGKVRGVCFAPDGLTCAVGGVGQFVVFDVDL